MNFENHISELLYRHQCVVVPGFGAFLTEETSAKIDQNNNVFYAPKKLISFNANLRNNDGLLANRIVTAEKISYENAVSFINIEVKKWFETLESENIIPLKNIGNLGYNSDKNLVFEPSNSYNYLTTSFGLSTFSSNDVHREVETPIIVLESKNLIEKKPITILNPEKKSGKYANLKYAAVFLIGCGIASPVFLNLYKERLKINNFAVQANVQKIVNSKIQEATFVINPLENVGISNAALNYHVVAGAFKNEANADKACKKLIAKGFEAKKIENNYNGLFTVIYNSYSNYADARNAMANIQIDNNPEAWVLIQELEK